MKNIFFKVVTFFVFTITPLHYLNAMEQERSLLNQYLFQQARAITKNKKMIEKCKKEIDDSNTFISNENYKFICNMPMHIELYKESPLFIFGTFCWKKRVEKLRYIFGKIDPQATDCLVPSFEIDSGENDDDDRLFNELYKEKLKEALEKDVWNFYRSTEDVYCHKTKFLFSAAITLGIASLWYYTKPFTFQSTI